MVREQEIASEIDRLKRRLRERERERKQNCERVLFGDEYFSDQC